MKFAVEVATFDLAESHQIETLLQTCFGKANLNQQSEYISRVIVLATPHYTSHISEMAQQAVKISGCLNVWGGCVAGLICNGKAVANEPTILVAIFDGDYEAQGQQATLRLILSDFEAAHQNVPVSNSKKTLGEITEADTMGLLSYGANYSRLPRLEHGRLCDDEFASVTFGSQSIRIFNSEGLEFLGPEVKATACTGKFLISAENVTACQALLAPPPHQTKPVGLRLQVIHKDTTRWVPVMELLADGTMALTESIEVGDKVRLATRTPKASASDLAIWLKDLKLEKAERYSGIGFLMAGFERSELCHSELDDIRAVCESFPAIHWIGILGQAAWLSSNDKLLFPARNNRLSMCLLVNYV